MASSYAFRHLRGLLVIVTAFASGSLLSYLAIVTPHVDVNVIGRERNTPMFNSLRLRSRASHMVANGSLTTSMLKVAKGSLTTPTWKDALVNHSHDSSGQNLKNMGKLRHPQFVSVLLTS